VRVYRPHLERALSHPLLLLLAWVAASYGAAGPSAVAEELLGPEKARSADERAASSGPLNAEEARQFWSFRPLVRTDSPSVKNPAWVQRRIDDFVLATLEANGLSPSPQADRRALIRRATFDVIGLPPSPEEVEAFVQDNSPDSYQQLVDRLLASPHYGERWGSDCGRNGGACSRTDGIGVCDRRVGVCNLGSCIRSRGQCNRVRDPCICIRDQCTCIGGRGGCIGDECRCKNCCAGGMEPFATTICSLTYEKSRLVSRFRIPPRLAESVPGCCMSLLF